MHPFTRLQKELPHKSNLFHEYLYEPNDFSFDIFFSKFVLFASPSQTSDDVVMAMYGCGCYLAFCWPADKSWTKIRPVFGASLFEVVYCNNKFYSVTVDAWGRVFTYNNGGPNSTLTYHHVTMLLKELAEACGCCLKQLYWNHQALCC